jgi:hypothetical protein
MEEHLRREEWDLAGPVARALVEVFTRANVTLAKVEALNQLRRAVEHHEVTPDFVRSVREYLSLADPTEPFTAPQATKTPDSSDSQALGADKVRPQPSPRQEPLCDWKRRPRK